MKYNAQVEAYHESMAAFVCSSCVTLWREALVYLGLHSSELELCNLKLILERQLAHERAPPLEGLFFFSF